MQHLVVNGILDKMISARNSYLLAEHLPERNAVDLARRGARFALSVSRLLRATRDAIPGLVRASTAERSIHGLV
jgi:hypothetical protein